MIKSWLDSARAVAVSGALLLGVNSTAVADHPSIDVTVSTPGLYTRFATGPRYGYDRYYAPGGYYAYAQPPVPVYVPGYWTYYYPQQGYWRDANRGYDGRQRHHNDRGRHEGERHRKRNR